MRPSVRRGQPHVAEGGFDVPDGVVAATDTEDPEKPRVVGYVFLRDRVGWAIVALLAADILVTLFTAHEEQAILRDLVAQNAPTQKKPRED